MKGNIQIYLKPGQFSQVHHLNRPSPSQRMQRRAETISQPLKIISAIYKIKVFQK